MSSPTGFLEQVTDAYEHLFDIVYLRTHPLTERLIPDAVLSREEKAWQLHHLLLDLVDRLDPGPQAPAFSRSWRRHRLMVLRYVNGLDTMTVASQLGISRRTYYREHDEALMGVTGILQDEHPSPLAPKEPPAVGEDQPSLTRLALLRTEAARSARAERNAVLADVLQSAIELTQELARANGIRVSVALGSAPQRVGMDRNTLKQLLLGALSFLVEGLKGGEIRLATQHERSQVVLSMQAQGAKSVTPLGETSGGAGQVRVSLLSELALMQGARLEPLDEAEGACGFRLVLPTTQPPVVLVVDDNEDIVRLFEYYLSQHDYQVIAAQTGAQAVDLAKAHQPFAITLDLMMPDQDGWDTLQILTNQPETQHIPVIVCTVLSAKELALSLGATLFLEKPITQQALLQALRSLEASA